MKFIFELEKSFYFLTQLQPSFGSKEVNFLWKLETAKVANGLAPISWRPTRRPSRCFPDLAHASESPFSPPFLIKWEWFSLVRSWCRACSFIQGYGKGDLHHLPQHNHQCTFIFSGLTIGLHHLPPPRQPSHRPSGQGFVGQDHFGSISCISFSFNFLY